MRLRGYILVVGLLAAWVLTGAAATPGVKGPAYSGSRPTVSDWIGQKDYSQPSLGLIDPSRLDVSHTVSVGGAFGGGQSLMQSLYAANFAYRLSDPLTLNFTVGMQNLKYNSPGMGDYTSPLGGVSLDYRPSKNFRFIASFQRGPYCGYALNSAPFNYYGGYHDPLIRYADEPGTP